jgi:hypothetical protein
MADNQYDFLIGFAADTTNLKSVADEIKVALRGKLDVPVDFVFAEGALSAKLRAILENKQVVVTVRDDAAPTIEKIVSNLGKTGHAAKKASAEVTAAQEQSTQATKKAERAVLNLKKSVEGINPTRISDLKRAMASISRDPEIGVRCCASGRPTTRCWLSPGTGSAS